MSSLPFLELHKLCDESETAWLTNNIDSHAPSPSDPTDKERRRRTVVSRSDFSWNPATKQDYEDAVERWKKMLN
jgi:hypothetical protein